jgi:hypothetical protein
MDRLANEHRPRKASSLRQSISGWLSLPLSERLITAVGGKNLRVREENLSSGNGFCITVSRPEYSQTGRTGWPRPRRSGGNYARITALAGRRVHALSEDEEFSLAYERKPFSRLSSAAVAERARKLGGTTLRSIGDISRHQRLKDNDYEAIAPQYMLSELCEDNQHLTQSLRSAHGLCDRQNDVATASLIEVWIDETERRTWFLSEIIGPNQPS